MSELAIPRALIADDQWDVLVALQLLLKGEGIATDCATSPSAVLEKVAASKQQGDPYDVVLMDMNYARDTTSGREGLDLITRLQALDQALPVIAMTAWANVELAVEAMQHGLGDFVQKPWNNSRLLQVLREQLAVGRRKRAAKNEWTEARVIQQHLMPRQSLQQGHCEWACVWQPAREVGGDYCDLAALDERHVAFCIGDVSGKGLPAALLMANLQAAVKANEHVRRQPQQLVALVNRLICENTTNNKFITFFYAVVDTVKQQLTYVNAGHNAPLLLRADGRSERLTKGGVILGVLPDQQFAQATVTLQPGDQVLLYTDGISEAMNADGEDFGEERLAQLGRNHSALDSYAVLQRIQEAVVAFHQAEERDDRTMMLLQVR